MREPLRVYRPAVLQQGAQLPQPGLGEEGARPKPARPDLDQAAVEQALNSERDLRLALVRAGVPGAQEDAVRHARVLTEYLSAPKVPEEARAEAVEKAKEAKAKGKVFTLAEMIPGFVTPTQGDAHLLELAIERNAKHGRVPEAFAGMLFSVNNLADLNIEVSAVCYFSGLCVARRCVSPAPFGPSTCMC